MTQAATSPRHPNPGFDPRSERGASPASVIIILVSVLMFAELIVMGGRVAAAHASVAGAAREAARQGSLVLAAGSVSGVAESTAASNLRERGRTCESPNVSTRGTDFRQGGQVTVTVSCTVNISDLSILSVPWPTRTFSSTATELVETYRAVE